MATGGVHTTPLKTKSDPSNINLLRAQNGLDKGSTVLVLPNISFRCYRMTVLKRPFTFGIMEVQALML